MSCNAVTLRHHITENNAIGKIQYRQNVLQQIKLITREELNGIVFGIAQ